MEKGIVDIHCHTAGIGAGGSGCFVSAALRRSWRYRFFLAAFGVTQQELERCGDSLVMQRLSERLAESRFVSAAVVLAMDGMVGENGRIDRQRTELYIPNDYLARECRKYDNLLFGASINPFRGDALERLDRATEEGAALLKWLPSIQLINPADSRITPFYNRLRELGLPLLTHTGYEESFTWARNELADPELLRLPLELGVTVIAAHAASNGRTDGERHFDRFLRLCDRFPNLYADISALTQANRLGQLPRLLSHGRLHERLLYGTDTPILSTSVTSPWFHAYRLSPGTVWRIAAIANPWDRDVELKLALGMPEEILANSARFLEKRLTVSSRINGSSYPSVPGP